METKPEWLAELEIIGDADWQYAGYIVRQQLIDTRGWNEMLIDEFLEPDLIETNPHNSFQMMRLYKQEKVFSVERTDFFKMRFLELTAKKFDPVKHTYLPQMVNKLKNRINEKRRIRRKNMRIEDVQSFVPTF